LIDEELGSERGLQKKIKNYKKKNDEGELRAVL